MPGIITMVLMTAFIIMCILLIFTKNSNNYKNASKMALDDKSNNPYENTKEEE